MAEVIPLKRQPDSATVERLDGARRALAAAESLPEVALIVDYAEAAKVAAKRAGLAEQSQRSWATFSLEAQRKAGELLRAMPKAEGAATPRGRAGQPRLREVLDTKTDQQAKDRSANWQKVANVPEVTFKEYVENAPEPTRAGLLDAANAAAVATSSATDAPEVQQARYVAKFLAHLRRIGALAAEYDPAELGPLLDGDGYVAVRMAADTFTRFADRVGAAREDPAR